MKKHRTLFESYKNRDEGMTLMPWILLYFFVSLCLFLLLFTQNIHISTKYLVQDSLAAAALAGEVVDLEVLSQDKELIIRDLDYSREVFEDSLKASLNLSTQGYPAEQSVYLDHRVPVTVEELIVYNVANGQIYKTDLLQSTGILRYETGTGVIPDSRCISLGSLVDSQGQFSCTITMLDGQQKEIRTTSLYARISFGVTGYKGDAVIVEKDILTDVQENK